MDAFERQPDFSLASENQSNISLDTTLNLHQELRPRLAVEAELVVWQEAAAAATA